MADRPFYENRYKLIAAPEVASMSNEELCTVCSCPGHKAEDHCEICKSAHTPCKECGSIVHVGQWATCGGNADNHGSNIKHYGFEPYVDEHLPGGSDVGYNYQGEKVVGHFIASRSDRQRIMKEQGVVSGGWGSNKHRSSKKDRNTHFENLANNIVDHAAAEWSRRSR